MSITYRLISETLQDLSIKYTISFYKDFVNIYSYSQISVNYGGGLMLPSSSEIISKADTNLSSLNQSHCGVSIASGLVCTYSGNRLNINNMTTLSDGRIFGNYLNSDSPTSLESPYCSVTIFTNIVHNYQYGTITESYANNTMYIYNTNGDITSNPCDFGNSVGSYDCSRLELVYINTNVLTIPTTLIETNCCITACCYPNEYIYVP